MTFTKSSIESGSFVPSQWIGRDGMPINSGENIDHLNDHLQKIHTLCQQTFEEAMHMGCSEEFLRIVLQNMISSLKRTTRKPFNS